MSRKMDEVTEVMETKQGLLSQVLRCDTWLGRLICGAILVVLAALAALVFERVGRRFLADPEGFNRFLYAWILAIELLVVAFLVLRRTLATKPEGMLLCIMLICGSIFIYSSAMNDISWDQFIHYGRVADYSNRLMGTADEGYEYSDTLITDRVFYRGWDYNAEEGTGFDYLVLDDQDIVDTWRFLNENEHSQEVPYTNEASVGQNTKLPAPSPYNLVVYYLAYTPSALLVSLEDLCGLPFSVRYLSIEFLELLLYSLLCFFGMRRLKSGKMILAVIALLPTAVFLATKPSYDYWVTGFTIFATAYLVGELQQPDKVLRLRDILIMLLSFCIGIAPKLVYFPLIFLMLLLPKDKFPSPRASRIFRICMVGVPLLLAAIVVVPRVLHGFGSGDARGGTEVNASEQVKFILHNPIQYLLILARRMLKYLLPGYARDYMTCFDETGFGTTYAVYASTSILMVIYTLFIGVILTDKREEDLVANTVRNRIVAVLVFLVSLGLVCTAMYISFTAVGSHAIAGAQERYMIPLLFPCVYFLGSPKWFSCKIRPGIYNTIVLAIMASSLMLCWWQVWMRVMFFAL